MRKMQQLIDGSQSLYFGQAMMWLAVDYTSPELRREALASTKRLSAAFPTEISISVRIALYQLLFEDKRTNTLLSDPDVSRHRATRLAAILSSSASLDNQPDAVKERLIADLLLVSHHKIFSMFLISIKTF